MKPNNTGIVDIRGKQYKTVALRVAEFRANHMEFSLVTDIIHRDLDCVVVRATILDPSGRVIATGHAEEFRSSSSINKTSALENCESSAIGRCLAAFGLGGSEFASADEVAHAINGKRPAPTNPINEAIKWGRENRARIAACEMIEDWDNCVDAQDIAGLRALVKVVNSRPYNPANIQVQEDDIPQ